MITRTSTHITFSLYRGSLVLFSAVLIGLVLGVLYSWSVIKAGIPASWGWSTTDKTLPYSTMCVIFSIVMVPAGRLQDRFGPRWVVFLGGLLAGLGCVVAGVGDGSRFAYIIGFGVLTGMGAGLAYAALTPTAIKWFGPDRTGLVIGIVVAGNALASVVLAPFSSWLLNHFAARTVSGELVKGVSQTMVALGLTTWLVVGSLFWFISNPPAAIMDGGHSARRGRGRGGDRTWREMLKTPQFWLLYLMLFAAASGGLTFISVAAELGRRALGELAFLSVVVLALGDGTGRIGAGIVSDRIGRQLTLCLEFLLQTAMIALLYRVSVSGSEGRLEILAILFFIGLNYGANLTIFPAACKEMFGIRYFGLNYGCLFTAFGMAGVGMPLLNGLIRDLTGKQDLSYLIIAVMMLVAAALALASRYLEGRSAKCEPVGA